MNYEDPQSWFPQSDVAASTLATVFYVHPTTYTGDRWNQDVANAPDAHVATSEIVAQQTAPFASWCRILAPRYRQASSRAFRAGGTEADAAYAFAYGDVCAAFHHYVRHWHRGRLILLGHSQGAHHIGHLVAEVIEPQGLMTDLIAAYPIGIGFSEALFGTRFRVIQPCERPDQTQCLVSWNTFLQGGDPSGFLQRTGERDSVFLGSSPPGPPVCINPISFDANRPDMPGTRVKSGVLWVDDAPAGMPPLPGGNMHMHDIALFTQSLGENAKLRSS